MKGIEMPTKLPINTFDYKNVRLLPEECQVESRGEVDTEAPFGPLSFKIPVVPANMSTVIGEDLAIWLATNGYFYVMHRFDVDAVDFTRRMHEAGLFASISIGIKDSDYALIDELAKFAQPEYLTIDVAHGHSIYVNEILKYARNRLKDSFIIVGNVATGFAVKTLESHGADAVKVGIGPGSACLTTPNTGFGTQSWQLSAVEFCAEAAKSALIVADGGISHYGDIAKSVAFGADMVMIGGMFAGHDESPGGILVTDEGVMVKSFFGSASADQKGEQKHVEGKRMTVPYRGPISNTLKTIEENLQSSVSYVGGTKLSDLRNAVYILV